MKFLVVTTDTKVFELRRFLEQAGPNADIRAKNGVLYCREGRKGNSLSHLRDHLRGHTKDKRGAVMALVEQVFADDNIDLQTHMQAVLSPHEVAHLNAGHGDLKVEHLLKVFTGTVQVHGETYHYERLKKPLNKGDYGEIYKAVSTNKAEQLALKTPLQRATAEDVALRKEAAMQSRARQAALSQVNYVVETAEPVMGSDGRVFQPMNLALCSANKLLDKFKLPDDEQAVDCLMALTARDWLLSLVQIDSIGMAHRDFKPENQMLSQDGVWQLGDFGTAGDANTVFQPTGDKRGNRGMTGNRSAINKAPEWASSEQRGMTEKYTVGHKTDVFAWGVAVFRMVLHPRVPFTHPAEQKLLESDYEETMLRYATSPKLFCEWYFDEYGEEIPLPWQDLLNRAMHSDPAARATAEELLDSPLFMTPMPVSEAELRQQLVQMAKAPAATDGPAT